MFLTLDFFSYKFFAHIFYKKKNHWKKPLLPIMYLSFSRTILFRLNNSDLFVFCYFLMLLLKHDDKEKITTSERFRGTENRLKTCKNKKYVNIATLKCV